MPRPIIAPVVRVRRGVSAAVTVVACVALLSACGSSKSSIEKSIFAQRHLRARVVCPVTVVQEQGKTFECIATTRAAKKPYSLVKTPFIVTVQNTKGYVTYAGK
jgi:alpha-D-ribose 1-methylphosphonate 5-triphosphate synthase subunit PhnL